MRSIVVLKTNKNEPMARTQLDMATGVSASELELLMRFDPGSGQPPLWRAHQYMQVER